jgi:hypothetical protein
MKYDHGSLIVSPSSFCAGSTSVMMIGGGD